MVRIPGSVTSLIYINCDSIIDNVHKISLHKNGKFPKYQWTLANIHHIPNATTNPQMGQIHTRCTSVVCKVYF